MLRSRTIAILLLLLSPLAFAAACGDDPAGEGGEGADIEDFEDSETVETPDPAADLNLEGKVGETVTVVARTGETFRNAVGIGGDTFEHDPVLVVGRDLPSTAAGAVVRVTGTVRELAIPELEQEIGVDLDEDEIGGGFDFALVASEVEVLEPAATVTEER